LTFGRLRAAVNLRELKGRRRAVSTANFPLNDRVLTVIIRAHRRRQTARRFCKQLNAHWTMDDAAIRTT